MHSEGIDRPIAVFDLGGTWFRWGRFAASHGLLESHRAPAISYRSHPDSSVEDLQHALTDFILRRTREMRDASQEELHFVSVSVGAPVNAHDETVLGSGPLWGPAAKPLQLKARLRETVPELEWYVVNDVTALLARYMEAGGPFKKTLLITISSGIGSRLYDHRARRIPYDPTHGVQGEIGHLPLTFELEGRVINRQCECGGWNHLNAFASGRGIADILRTLPSMCGSCGSLLSVSSEVWERANDEYRLEAFETRLEQGNGIALALLDALVTPVSRTLTTALCLDPEIDRIVITGGVAHGLGRHYREALHRAFGREGLYQMTSREPQYLARRLYWDDADDFAGLRGAGLYAEAQSVRADVPRN